MKYLLILLLAMPLSAAPKECAKKDAVIKRLVSAVADLSKPEKVKTFEDANVRIRYHDGEFAYELKPQEPTVLVITTTRRLRFRPDKKKTTVRVLDRDGNEIKAKVTTIEGN